MSTHTGIFIRPTLQEAIAGWSSIGYTKAEALRAVVALRLASNEPHGKGNRAYKREGLLSTMRDERLAQAMKVRDRRMHADLYFDREVEARSYPQHEAYPL